MDRCPDAVLGGVGGPADAARTRAEEGHLPRARRLSRRTPQEGARAAHRRRLPRLRRRPNPGRDPRRHRRARLGRGRQLDALAPVRTDPRQAQQLGQVPGGLVGAGRRGGPRPRRRLPAARKRATCRGSRRAPGWSTKPTSSWSSSTRPARSSASPSRSCGRGGPRTTATSAPRTRPGRKPSRRWRRRCASTTTSPAPTPRGCSTCPAARRTGPRPSRRCWTARPATSSPCRERAGTSHPEMLLVADRASPARAKRKAATSSTQARERSSTWWRGRADWPRHSKSKKRCGPAGRRSSSARPRTGSSTTSAARTRTSTRRPARTPQPSSSTPARARTGASSTTAGTPTATAATACSSCAGCWSADGSPPPIWTIRGSRPGTTGNGSPPRPSRLPADAWRRGRDGAAGGAGPPDDRGPAALSIGSDAEIARFVVRDLERRHGPIVFCEGVFWCYAGTHWEALPDEALWLAACRYDGALVFTPGGRLLQRQTEQGARRVDPGAHAPGPHAERSSSPHPPSASIACPASSGSPRTAARRSCRTPRTTGNAMCSPGAGPPRPPTSRRAGPCSRGS